MTIFENNIRRILKSKSGIVTMLLIPLGFILMVTLISSGGGANIRVGVADDDQTPLTEMLINNLENKGQVIRIPKDHLSGEIVDLNIQYGIYIPEGFTDEIIGNMDPKIQGYASMDTNISRPIAVYVDSFLDAAKNISEVSNEEQEKFYAGLEAYGDGSFNVVYHSIESNVQGKIITTNGIGFLIMGILVFSLRSSTLILEDKENRTFYRIFAAPIHLKSFMMQNILSFVVLSIIQINLVLFFMSVVFNMDLGPSVINLFVILLVFSIVCIALGLAISSMVKDVHQLGVLSTFIVTPMVMLGGSFWPREIMPEALQRVSTFVPTTWALEGATKVLYGDPLSSMTQEIFILMLFAVVFFLLGSWKNTDIID
ncbi:ABC-2 type transporter [Alkaliphilus metalliredigens QYMF]|uniref:ABC-2 type transporter n=1 Tax=Alkaliphilus metalliredigens (strain QYMF) TaxID=293826 RepID=A6TVR6_ALKMQ|nr:ABC transporter permease [Alkaliphilus metalliredigens]ABR50284.1 ABC-2 type transporter [Alkaliphilus metalliredigens QYMF]